MLRAVGVKADYKGLYNKEPPKTVYVILILASILEPQKQYM